MKLSKYISLFFHPINFPIIGVFLYFILVPKFIFKPQEHIILTVILIGTYIFPLVFLFLLKRFKMIHNYKMENIDERKFPTLLFIAISFIIANWLFKTHIVNLLSLLYFGYGLSLITSYIFLHFKYKISLHMAAVGGLIGFLIYFSVEFKINLIWFLAAFFILGGVIASARLILKAHNPKEVFFGFLTGFSIQIFVYGIYYIM